MSFGIRCCVVSTSGEERNMSTKCSDEAKNMSDPTIIGKSPGPGSAALSPRPPGSFREKYISRLPSSRKKSPVLRLIHLKVIFYPFQPLLPTCHFLCMQPIGLYEEVQVL